MLKENDIVSVIGVDYTSEGIGLAKVDGFPIFIYNLIIGEEAEVKIVKVLRNYALGKIINFIHISPDRIKPLIPETIHLGGCQFTQLSYEKEVEHKKAKVERALRVIGGLQVNVEKIYAAPNPYFYRNKTVLPLSLNKQGKVFSGLYRHNTHEIVAMDKTHLDDERASDIMREIRQLAMHHELDIYDERTHSGDIRKVMIRTSHYLDEIMVVLVTRNRKVRKLDLFCADLITKMPSITTIIQNINPDRTNVILGTEEVVLYGPGFIRDQIHQLTFSISSQSFFQVNTLQAEKLYERAVDLAKLTKNDIVIDAYSGIGTIALIAARQAKEVIGVEIVKEAVNDAKNNSQLNRLTNVSFHEQDSGEFLVNQKNLKSIDVLFVDPPRKGLSTLFIEQVKIAKPSRVVYISCDPATLARDLKILTEIYDIKSVECLDMFPRTSHVETITLLSLKTA